MPKASPIQGNFNGGELSPLLAGRIDSDRYKIGLALCLNFIPTIQGGLTRRPGTYYTADCKYASKISRLIEFEFSTTQAYILEFGDLYIRFYANGGQIETTPGSGVPYEISTPYLESEIFEVKFTQSADVLYVVHPNHPPAKITRTAHNAWTYTVIDFLDGPYLNTNTTTTTLSVSGTTLTASAPTGINGGAGFSANDIGRLVRILNGTTWTKYKITAVSSTTSATVTVITGPAAGATTSWRLGVWSKATGFPAAIVFHEDRLWFGGAASAPQRIDGSQSGDYENFSPTDLSGVVTANMAPSYTLNSNDVNVIRWLASGNKGLYVGTVGGEWLVAPASSADALSATNVVAREVTFYGSANLQPVQIGNSIIFIQRSARKARELTYVYQVDGYQAPDLTVIAEHIARGGFFQLAYQKEPQSILWAIRGDGLLAAMTYERDLDALKVAWHRHIIGGVSDAAGSPAQVESVAAIPSIDGSREEIWMVVRRFINGQTKRYVEVLTGFFDEDTDQSQAFFVDAGLTYDDPKEITNVTSSNPAVVTSTAHGFNNGDKVLISDVKGVGSLNSDNTITPDINGRSFIVANKTANTFELSGYDTGSFAAYVSGGNARRMVSAVAGLDHLEGEPVQILADGAVQPEQVVVGGAVTLPVQAAVIHVGLGYNSDIQLLRQEAGSADGTAMGKTRRTHRVGILLHRSLGLELGLNFEELTTLTFRTSHDAMTRAPALYSGILSEVLDAGYDFENQICIRQNQPLPSTILAIMPQMVTQDRG